MDYEEVLHFIGQCGRWQKRIVVLAWSASLMCGMAYMQYSFAVGTPVNYRCLIPECETAEEAKYEAPWKDKFIPVEDSTIDKCSYYSVPTSNGSSWGNCSLLQPNAERVKCDRWVFSDDIYTSTLVTEFGIVCDRMHLKSAIGMGYTIAAGTGAYFMGYMSDHFGRKLLSAISIFGTCLASLLTSFSTSYAMFLGFHLLGGLLINGTYFPPLVLIIEYVGEDYSAMASLLTNIPFVIGELLTIWIAYNFRDFRTLIRVSIIPCFLLVICFYFIPESPRWLIVKKREEEALAIIKKGAKINGKELPPEMKITLNEKNEEKADRIGILDLLRSPCLRKRLIIMYIIWTAVVMSYGGLTLNGVNLGGNVFFNMAIGVIVEIPAYIFPSLTVDRFGRVPILVLCLFLSGGSSIIATFIIDYESTWPLITLATIAKFGTSAAFAIAILQVGELFPTNARATAMGSCSLMSRGGGILAPLIANIGAERKEVPLIAFGLVGVVSGVAACFLPETADKELPESIEEAEEQDDAKSVADCFKGIAGCFRSCRRSGADD